MCIFDDLIFVIGYTVARLVLPLFSFHKIYVQPLNSPEWGFNALGYRCDDSGRIEIESTIAGGIEFVIFLIAFFAFCLLIRATA